jgi:hypothetical protein
MTLTITRTEKHVTQEIDDDFDDISILAMVATARHTPLAL